MINYEELLDKYIEHIDCCEGDVFLSRIWFQDDGLTSRNSDVTFTLEELAELRRLAGWT